MEYHLEYRFSWHRSADYLRLNGSNDGPCLDFLGFEPVTRPVAGAGTDGAPLLNSFGESSRAVMASIGHSYRSDLRGECSIACYRVELIWLCTDASAPRQPPANQLVEIARDCRAAIGCRYTEIDCHWSSVCPFPDAGAVN